MSGRRSALASRRDAAGVRRELNRREELADADRAPFGYPDVTRPTDAAVVPNGGLMTAP